jgi:hypothetical protein
MKYATYLKLVLAAFIISFGLGVYAVVQGVLPPSMLILLGTGIFVAVCAIASDNDYQKMSDGDA